MAAMRFIPSIMEVIRRMLPTYPRHAGRRCEELREVEETMLMSGLTPRIVRAVCEVTSDLATVGWPSDRDSHQWTITEVIKQMNQERLSRTSELPSDPPQRGLVEIDRTPIGADE